MHFEVVLRRNGADTPVVAWDHHFDPLGAGIFDAQLYEADAEGTAIDFVAGDQIVFRYTGQSTTTGTRTSPTATASARRAATRR